MLFDLYVVMRGLMLLTFFQVFFVNEKRNAVTFVAGWLAKNCSLLGFRAQIVAITWHSLKPPHLAQGNSTKLLFQKKKI